MRAVLLFAILLTDSLSDKVEDIVHSLITRKAYAHYILSSVQFNPDSVIIKDFSRHGRDVLIPSEEANDIQSVFHQPNNGNGRKFSAIRGSTSTQIHFTRERIPQYTLFHVARYSPNGRRGRIFASNEGNWLSGFWNEKSGVAHHEDWITPPEDFYASNWIVSTDTAANYRSNGFTIPNQNIYSTSTISYLPPLVVNALTGSCCPSETSDFEIAEVIIFDEILSPAEVEKIEASLIAKYGIHQTVQTKNEPSSRFVSSNFLIRITPSLCKTEPIRLGNEGDGGWTVCNTFPAAASYPKQQRRRHQQQQEKQWLNSGPDTDAATCLVYSYGILHDYSFDEACEARGCYVYGFDPSVQVRKLKAELCSFSLWIYGYQ